MENDNDILTLKDAKERRLIQLKIWLTVKHLNWLRRERDRISSDNNRDAIVVSNGNMYSLFVNDVSIPETNKVEVL